MENIQVIELAYNRLYMVDRNGVRVLIDAGPDYAGSAEELHAAIGDRLPDAVVTTHGHNDHAGLGRWWQERGVPVALDDDDHHLARQPRLLDEEEWGVFEDYVESTGAPTEIREAALTGLRRRRDESIAASRGDGYPPASSRGARWPTGIRMLPFQPFRFADVGDVLGAAGIEILRCPGHTPGNVVAALPGQGIVFSGDQLLPDITPTPGIQATPPETGGPLQRFRSLPAFVESLRHLRGREWEYCYPGHGDAFADTGARIDENLAAIEDRSNRVREALATLGKARVYAIAETLYPKALSRRFWQIIATVQGNLDLLEAAGEVVEEDGVYRIV